MKAARVWKRRTFLTAIGAGGGALAGGFQYAWSEAENLQVKRVPVDSRWFPAPRGLKILHLTDLHLGPDVSLEMISRAVDLGIRQQPDLIALTGDYISGMLRQSEDYSRVLSRLSAFAPTFACTGNHDGWLDSNPKNHEIDTVNIAKMLADAGIVRLDNQTREIVVKGQVMRVSGLSDLWAGENHPEKCLRKVNEVTGEKTPVLLLNHNPDARASLMGYEWHLMLSGHTHGGQCGIPLVNQILSPVKDKSHIEGLKEREGRLVHISRGIGNLHGIRLMCPPEVNVLEVY